MSVDIARDIPKSGFNFDNCKRNAQLLQNGFVPPKVVKTGTTIVGIIYKDGVILGADTRATEGPIVSDKNCSKIHYLAKNMYCCGAGTAADTEMTTDSIASQLELHRLNTGRQVPVVAANTLLKQMLFRYQGHISAALVLGGVDKTGAYIYCIHPHGSTDKLPYATMGSGSLAAMSVFESRWKPDMEEEEGKLLVRDAIRAGIFNDLGSGSNVDLCVIRKDSCDYLRNYELSNQKGERKLNYDFKLGTTAVLDTKIHKFEITEEVLPVPMEE
ncbi:proteasome subunit beta type-7 [Episyrphus balteatus]|uniref:proteasome subunit beta type-7 n=1 Tax=Episyrphus balteatus TaxID=286459 RepID=UPI0024857D28|nr:proteasome subunit beta type-7 [Episyrphus balteatus]